MSSSASRSRCCPSGWASAWSRGTSSAVDLGDEIWFLGQRWNGTVAARSLDQGLSWTEVSFGPPPASGTTVVTHLVRGTDGRYLAVARRDTSCRGGVEAGEGFTALLTCTRRFPVVFVSDDGVNWSQPAPVGLAPPEGSSLRINDLIAVEGGYLAAGTIEGPDWRAVLYSSSDGVTWTAEREFVGDGNPMSSRSVAHDGTTLVFTADETPCASGPDDNVGGWQLGAGFARHGRIFTGVDIASLTLQQPGEHPLAAAPLDISPDCAPIGDIPFSFYPYPSFSAEVLDGTLTVFELYVPPDQRAQVEAAEDADDDELAEELRSTLGTRRWAQLVDGAWTATEIEEVNVPGVLAVGANGRLVATSVDGRPAFAEVHPTGTLLNEFFLVTDDDPAQVESATPIVFLRSIDVVGVSGGVIVIAVQGADPFVSEPIDAPKSIVAWRTTAGEGSPAGLCDLEPGGFCQAADLTEHPDYPDFSDRDLAGVDLTGTDIGSANFEGADLTGARLWLVTSDRGEPPTFAGADLGGAELQRAEMGDISGATVDGASFADAQILRADGVDFSDAVMRDVQILDLGGIEFGDADLTGARLDIVDTFPDLTELNFRTIGVSISLSAEGPFEFDLSGLDLTGVSFSGPLSSDPVVITSLDGTVLADTAFRNADLTRLDPAIDLTGADMQFGVICPDGGEPEGVPGSCVRDGA